MVENRKLFYAISVLLLSCCQIITMFPHNVAEVEKLQLPLMPNSNSNSSITDSSSGNINNNSEYNRANIDSGSDQSYNSPNDEESEFIIAVERKHYTMGEGAALPSRQGNVGVWETSPDSITAENVDDLIFLDKRPINQPAPAQQQQKHREYVAQLPNRINEQQRGHHSLFQIHHHLSADGLDSGSRSSSSEEHSTDSLTQKAFASNTETAFEISLLSSSSFSPLENVNHNDNDDDVAATDDGKVRDNIAESPHPDVALPPHEIDLKPKNNDANSMMMMAVIPLDLSDFLSLIPAERVKAIATNYYLNDPEVQRAYAFMSSRDFAELKHHIISIPEMSAFLRYLNNSGLDLVKFITALSNITTVTSSIKDNAMTKEKAPNTNERNDIEYAQKQNNIAAIQPTPTTTIANSMAATATGILSRNIAPTSTKVLVSEIPPSDSESTTASSSSSSSSLSSTEAATAAGGDIETTTIKEQLNGLHGLVDGILDVLPQDQILATFFDKLESSEQFSKLVDNIGSPEFAKILNNMQNSIPLRNLIFTLHNNGIYVIRIVESLKSYFFLGGF